VRVWIDDAPVIDDWTDGGALREPRGTVAAAAAGWHDLRVEWDQIAGPMTARLRYESPSQPRVIVPPESLRHLTDDTLADFENEWDLPLSAVTGVAASPHGTVVGGVSARPDLFWDAWVVPPDGRPPRRLAPIGLTLLWVDASGAVW